MISENEWSTILEYKTKMSYSPNICDQSSLASEYYKIITAASTNEKKRPLIFAHIAQTLDGRIACENGDSKWIGNEENLRHAHRMRAICDAVMVGKNTVVADDPQLTVRHVSGSNPIKLFLEGHSTEGQHYKKVCNLIDGPQELEIDWRKLPDLLDDLGALGIRSIYLEGGGKTISYFLEKGLVDHIQVHIAPIILGSGRPSFTLPALERISHALKLEEASTYNINGQMMISGPIRYE